MTPRNRARFTDKHDVGPGGRFCACCDNPPRMNKRVRRSVKRSERQSWQHDVTVILMEGE